MFRWFVLLLLVSNAFGAASVEFTAVPPYGSTNDLRGRVYGVVPANYRVAVLIYVAGAGGWYTKPNCGSPLTTIQADGTWGADVTTGGSDSNATRLAAFLVPASFSQPCVLGQACLPAMVMTQAIATAVADRTIPATQPFHWSGLDWWIKSSSAPVGPGPNYFSGSPSNVWVDAQSRLHLRILPSNSVWRCAEIISAQTPGYGTYTFHLAAPADALDPNATLGLFTWSDNPAFNFREIDIECGRWANASDPNNSQFVVQPYDSPEHLVRYRLPPGQTNSTHVFEWRTNSVAFTAAGITQWTYTNAVPPSCDESIHLNLWLFQGNPPQNGQPVEVIVEKFDFLPLDANGDGLPDAWALAHDVSLPNADDDGDGFTNLQEYRAGTDPANPQSNVRITAVVATPTNAVVTFQSTRDKTYALDVTGALQPPAWSVIVSNVAGTGGFVQIIDSGGASLNRFYRVRVEE